MYENNFPMSSTRLLTNLQPQTITLRNLEILQKDGNKVAACATNLQTLQTFKKQHVIQKLVRGHNGINVYHQKILPTYESVRLFSGLCR